MRRAIKEKFKRLEHSNIIEKVKGSEDWIRNLVVVSKNNVKVLLCLDACIENQKRIKSYTHFIFYD